MNKLLRILTAIFAITTALLGFASYLDKMPPEYAAVIGLVTAVLLGIKEIVVVIGDIADDGVRNGSFKPDGRKILSVLLLLSISLAAVGCSEFKTFTARHQSELNGMVIDAVQTTTDAALRKLTRGAESSEASREGGKQPRNVQPVRSADDADSETILEGPEPTAPVCEEPRGEALPACLKLTPAITIPRYGVQVASHLSASHWRLISGSKNPLNLRNLRI